MVLLEPLSTAVPDVPTRGVDIQEVGRCPRWDSAPQVSVHEQFAVAGVIQCHQRP